MTKEQEEKRVNAKLREKVRKLEDMILDVRFVTYQSEELRQLIDRIKHNERHDQR